MLHLKQLVKNSDSPQSSLEKYYVTCDDISDIATEISSIDTNNDRALLLSIVRNKRVVIKIGESATIKKEYDIGKRLSNIQGFIRYICVTRCHDDIEKYVKQRSNTTICTNNTRDPTVNILVMPFVKQGSMRTYQWDETNIDEFKSCIKQLICSLAQAFEENGFLHTDIHLGNVLIRTCNRNYIHYGNVAIQTHKKQICIMDFEHSFINVHHKETKMFFKDIKRIFEDITYALKMDFVGFQQLDEYVLKRIYSNIEPPLGDVYKLLTLIDGLVYNGKTKPIQYREYKMI